MSRPETQKRGGLATRSFFTCFRFGPGSTSWVASGRMRSRSFLFPAHCLSGQDGYKNEIWIYWGELFVFLFFCIHCRTWQHYSLNYVRHFEHRFCHECGIPLQRK